MFWVDRRWDVVGWAGGGSLLGGQEEVGCWVGRKRWAVVEWAGRGGLLLGRQEEVGRCWVGRKRWAVVG